MEHGKNGTTRIRTRKDFEDQVISNYQYNKELVC